MNKENKGAREVYVSSRSIALGDDINATTIQAYRQEPLSSRTIPFIEKSAYTALEQRLAEALNILDKCSATFTDLNDGHDIRYREVDNNGNEIECDSGFDRLNDIKTFMASLADGSKDD